MAQPRPMLGTVYHSRSSRQRMMGRFIQSPQAREYSGYDWRTSSPVYKRWKKRALAAFRRRDGKRFVLEGLAAVYADQFDRSYDEQAELRQEQYDTGLDYDDRFQDDYGCSCCGEYEDDWFHDGVDYSVEAAYAQDYDYEAAYRQEQYYDSYYESDYDQGYSAGYVQAMKDLQRRAS